MNTSEPKSGQYPLLESVLKQKSLPLLGIYKFSDAARILGSSVRTVQQWSRDGKLRCRDLPARGKFLSEDLETFLRDSRRRGDDDNQGR
jgi:transposase-like protein